MNDNWGTIIDEILEFALKFSLFLLILFPLGIWKLIEIIIWITKHIKLI